MKKVINRILSMRHGSASSKVLDLLLKTSKPLRPKEISDTLSLDIHRVTDILSNFHKGGLVHRTKDGYVSVISYLDLIIYVRHTLKELRKLKN